MIRSSKSLGYLTQLGSPQSLNSGLVNILSNWTPPSARVKQILERIEKLSVHPTFLATISPDLLTVLRKQSIGFDFTKWTARIELQAKLQHYLDSQDVSKTLPSSLLTSFRDDTAVTIKLLQHFDTLKTTFSEFSTGQDDPVFSQLIVQLTKNSESLLLVFSSLFSLRADPISPLPSVNLRNSLLLSKEDEIHMFAALQAPETDIRWSRTAIVSLQTGIGCIFALLIIAFSRNSNNGQKLQALSLVKVFGCHVGLEFVSSQDFFTI